MEENKSLGNCRDEISIYVLEYYFSFLAMAKKMCIQGCAIIYSIIPQV